MREAQVNLAIRCFMGYGLNEELPDHSSLTRIRQRWGAERFRRILDRTIRGLRGGSLFGLFNPFALVCGLLSVTMLVLHGAGWRA